MTRITESVLQKQQLKSQKRLLQFGNLVMYYVIAIGIFQFISALFGANLSLRTPMILIVYVGIIWVFETIIMSDADSFFELMRNKQFVITMVIVTVFLLVTPLVYEDIVPALFSIF